MRFKIGDLIIYGETGVCRVLDIVEKDFLGEVQNCYKLEPVYQSCTIFTPADNESVFMRPILTFDQAEKLVSEIESVEAVTFNAASPRLLSEEYDKIVKLHDCIELVRLTKSIYHKKQKTLQQKRKLSAIDERFLKKAEDLLFGELAASLKIEKASVLAYIESKIAQKA